MHLICPSPQISHNFFFSFLLGQITAVPREIENSAYAKFGGSNKVHHGKCGSGVWQISHFDVIRALRYSQGSRVENPRRESTNAKKLRHKRGLMVKFTRLT